ncbi:MAG: MgtC/SapB family protein [Gemmatimonadetes bacterium]|nr:MgtC/SapB family protein [Gemmatimonadota bacterium]
MTFSDLITLDPYSWKSILAAILCGSIVGTERQLRGRPVGIRTSILLVISIYIFITSYLSMADETSESIRIIGQVVTGVGFLGAGVMLSKNGMVIGVTSAATIWALASIGVCLAIGHPFVAIRLSVVVVIILVGVDMLEKLVANLTTGVHNK